MSFAAPNPQNASAAPGDSKSQFSSLMEFPSWAISCVLHVGLLLFLYSITLYMPQDEETVIDTAMSDEDVIPDEFVFDPTITDQLGSDSLMNTLSPSQAAKTQANSDPQEQLEKEIDQELVSVQQPQLDMVASPEQTEFVDTIDTTGATDYVGGVEGSMDRLTAEIAGSLRDRKTLVVWVFDASLSQQARRDEIADRFENVYKQLGQLDVDSGRALQTAVVSFGSSTNFITPEPVDDVGEIVKAIRKIKSDGTPTENVFGAVGQVINKWRSYRTKLRRNMMVIVVTDERGDDFELLEQTVQTARRVGVRCYCVGNAAPFGREKGYVLWKYEDGGEEYLPIDAGPESVAMERLNLGFWGGRGRDLDQMSSGYGPYALTRLCAETGGLYLVAEDSVRGPQFDFSVMRSYTPDYGPIREYEKELVSNAAKGALVMTARKTNVDRIVSPQLVFRADTDTVLRQQATAAQEPAAVFDFNLQQMQSMLERGEKDREKLVSPRWRAAYDLAMGRVLAMRVRAYGYNVVLADMKSTPKSFEKKGSNHWRLVPAADILGGPSVKKLAKKAKEYLTRVIDEHPGTPWAELAERELSQELGWDWQEFAVNLAPANRGGNNNPDGPQFADEEEKKNEMKKKAAQKKRVRPAL